MEHKQQTNILPKSVSLVEEGDLLRELEAFPSSCSQLLIIYDYLCLSFYLRIETSTVSLAQEVIGDTITFEVQLIPTVGGPVFPIDLKTTSVIE